VEPSKTAPVASGRRLIHIKVWFSNMSAAGRKVICGWEMVLPRFTGITKWKKIVLLLGGAIFPRKWVVFHDNTPCAPQEETGMVSSSAYSGTSSSWHLPRKEMENKTRSVGHN
jgi:hypothetical protein